MTDNTKKTLRLAGGFIAALTAAGYIFTITIGPKKDCDYDAQGQWALDCLDKVLDENANSKKRARLITQCYNRAEKLYCKN